MIVRSFICFVQKKRFQLTNYRQINYERRSYKFIIANIGKNLI